MVFDVFSVPKLCQARPAGSFGQLPLGLVPKAVKALPVKRVLFEVKGACRLDMLLTDVGLCLVPPAHSHISLPHCIWFVLPALPTNYV